MEVFALQARSGWGHCIGVDPFYLTYKAQLVGYLPEIIFASRSLNDSMGAHVANQLVKAMLNERIHVDGSRVLILGLMFKENCPVIRNKKLIDIIYKLSDYVVGVDCFDPWAKSEDAASEYDIRLIKVLGHDAYDRIVIAVAHQEFRGMGGRRLVCSENRNVLYTTSNIFYLLIRVA